MQQPATEDCLVEDCANAGWWVLNQVDLRNRTDLTYLPVQNVKGEKLPLSLLSSIYLFKQETSPPLTQEQHDNPILSHERDTTTPPIHPNHKPPQWFSPATASAKP